ncbi:MAG: hypothetical protein ABGW87_10450 [Sphingomonadaceae bacterium]
MNALRHDFDFDHSESLATGVPTPTVERMRAQWAAAQQAAGAIAGLAQLAPPTGGQCAALEAALVTGDSKRLAICESMLDDLTAVLHTGLTALLFAAENDCDTTAAALTLWREYDAARAALAALAGPIPVDEKVRHSRH